jgi:dephospho-CoA kinase
MILVGITGSIGCGKTTIANVIREQGYTVFDIDKWVKFLYYKKDFLKTIKSTFPECFISGGFNKRCLRNIVFSDNDKLKVLEGIIHPLLKSRIKKTIRINNENNSIVFMDVALLFEMGWDKYCDYIILADVDKNIQKNRVINRDGISEEDFYKIDKIQMSQDEKRKMVDFIIDTDVNYNKLRVKIINILMELE